MIDTHGLKMNGLGKAIEHINSWPKHEFRGYTQVDYNPKTGDVYIEDHVGDALGDSYCTYKDRAVIQIGFFANHMTEQKLADAIFRKVNEVKQAGDSRKVIRKVNSRHIITLSNGERVNTHGLPMWNMEKALREINNWGKYKGRTQIDYNLAGIILYCIHVSQTAYIPRENANVVALGCITGCITGQELADMIRDAVNERKKKEQQNESSQPE